MHSHAPLASLPPSGVNRMPRFQIWLAGTSLAAAMAVSASTALADPQVEKARRAESMACNQEMRALAASGASRQAVMQKMDECRARMNAPAQAESDERYRKQSPIAFDTLQKNRSARSALQEGRVQDAMALYRQIDANG